MAKMPNTHGGGAQTNINGLKFERETSFEKALANAGYFVEDCKIYKDGMCIGMSVPKKKLYKNFLKPMGIDYTEYNSKAWEPDECFINSLNRTAYIIEKKFQKVSGSVDEKLAVCDFKRWEYAKLFNSLGYEVKFLYVLNDWFKDNNRYDDMRKYIEDTGCYYFYNEIPMNFLQLP